MTVPISTWPSSLVLDGGDMKAASFTRDAVTLTDFTNLLSLSSLATTVGLVKQTSANTFGIDASVYLTTGVAASTYVPYTGATGAVDLGAQNLTTTGRYGQVAGSGAGIVCDPHVAGVADKIRFHGMSTANSQEDLTFQCNNSWWTIGSSTGHTLVEWLMGFKQGDALAFTQGSSNDVSFGYHGTANLWVFSIGFGITTTSSYRYVYDRLNNRFEYRNGATATITINPDTGNILTTGTLGAGAITSTAAITGPKAKMTAIGGFAVRLTNKTGVNSVAGQLVEANTAVNDSVILATAGDVDCIGVFYEAGVADGAEAWVVVAGIADVAFDDNVGPARGDWVSTGVLAGYAAAAASPAAAPTHFEEIGHCIETVAAGGAGTHVLARCVLHFN